VTADDRAAKLGVQPDVLRRLDAERDGLVAEVAEDPLAWGFGLLPSGVHPRDVVEEFRARTRTRGDLGESFLSGHGPLVELMPEHLMLPTTRRPIAIELVMAAGLEPDAAWECSAQLRAALIRRLGRPLDAEVVDQVARDVAWDHQLDAALLQRRITAVLAEVL